MSSNSPNETPRPTPEITAFDLLPDGIDVEEMGLLPTTRRQSPLVKDSPVRRARQFLRDANRLKEMVADGIYTPETEERLTVLIPELAKIARFSNCKRTRIQASKEIREWTKLLEGDASKEKGSGGMSIRAGNVQINVNANGEGPITSLTFTPEE